MKTFEDFPSQGPFLLFSLIVFLLRTGTANECYRVVSKTLNRIKEKTLQKT